MILLMSGLMIFNAHPNLYWGNISQPENAFFSIGAANDEGDLRGYVKLYGQQLDTTGLLGVQRTGLMPSARAFPSWLTVPGYYSLAAGRRWHFSSVGCSRSTGCSMFSTTLSSAICARFFSRRL